MNTIKAILNEPLTYFVTWVMMFIYTYGHCFVRLPLTYSCFGRECESTVAARAIEALFGAFFWPLYWSVHLAK